MKRGHFSFAPINSENESHHVVDRYSRDLLDFVMIQGAVDCKACDAVRVFFEVDHADSIHSFKCVPRKDDRQPCHQIFFHGRPIALNFRDIQFRSEDYYAAKHADGSRHAKSDEVKSKETRQRMRYALQERFEVPIDYSHLVLRHQQLTAHQLIRERHEAMEAKRPRTLPKYVVWGMGSGKSQLGAMAVLGDRLLDAGPGRDVYIVCPLSMIPMWSELFSKHVVRMPEEGESKKSESNVSPALPARSLRVRVLGYDAFHCCVTKAELGFPRGFLKDSIVIIDEAPHYRTFSDRMWADFDELRQAFQLILLSGTPIVNVPLEDARHIVYLMDPKSPAAKVLADPAKTSEADLYVRIRALSERGQFDWFDPILHDRPFYERHYPRVIELTVAVEMSWPQTADYMTVVHTKYRSASGGAFKYHEFPNNQYRNAERRICNVPRYYQPGDKLPPKLSEIARRVSKHYDRWHVIYGQFIELGVLPVFEVLRHDPNLAVRLITGETKNAHREHYRQEYNDRRANVCVITDVGNLGMSFECSDAYHKMHPAATKTMDDQGTSRVIRFNGHRKSKTNEVRIFTYISVFPSVPPTREDLAEMWEIYEALRGREKADFEEWVAFMQADIQAGRTTVEQDQLRTQIEKQAHINQFMHCIWDNAIVLGVQLKPSGPPQKEDTEMKKSKKSKKTESKAESKTTKSKKKKKKKA